MSNSTFSFSALFCVLFPVSLLSQIVIQPSQVSLISPAATAGVAVQTLTVLNSGPSVPFQAAVRYLGTTSGWLSVSPVSGTTPSTLTVSANPAGLLPGTYAGQVTITAGGIGAVANIFFTVVSGASGGTLTANPTGLTFIGQSGEGILTSQTLAVSSSTADPIGFTALASSQGNWLSVSPTNATTPASLTIGAIQSALAPGTYTGTITLTPTNGSPPSVVPVTLVAAGEAAPPAALQLSQRSLTINFQVGTPSPALQTINVFSTGDPQTFTASATTPWLKLSTITQPTPSADVTDITPIELRVQVDPTGLAPGSYAGSVTITSAGVAPQQLPVTFTVTTNAALNANPSAVRFDFDLTTSPPQTQTISVTSTGTSSIAFTASSSVPWLVISPASGSTTSTGSQDLMLTTDPDVLAPGTYRAVVTLSPSGGGGVAPLAIPVVVNVVGSTDVGDLVVTPDTLSLLSIVGGADAAQNLKVSTTQDQTPQTFTAAATSTGGWLAVDPYTARTPAKLTVKAKSSAVGGPGTYQGSVLLTSLATGNQTTVQVTYTLSADAIVADPVSLTFAQTERGTVPSSQTIALASPLGSIFAVRSKPDWVIVTPITTITPATLTVAIDPSKIPTVAADGNIVIGGPKNQLTIPVSFSPPTPVGILVAPESIMLTYQLGNPGPLSQTITVGKPNEVVPFTATVVTDSGEPWLTVSPASGNTPATVTATANISLLIPGRQTATINISGADASTPVRAIPVTLDVTSPNIVVQRLLHAASKNPTPVAPGQMVTITGTGLGPLNGVAAVPSAAGTIETTLANTTVLFDGVPAPLLFVQSTQINAIVPYAVYGRATSHIQVQKGTAFSVPIEANVVSSAPGLFTVASTGTGQAAALNSNATSNSLANPASRGSLITIFGTGEGQTDPAGQDGRILSTDLKRPLLPVIVRIGGRQAEVSYAGSTSGSVSGSVQINVRIPSDSNTGNVPVELQVGSATSQSGVTIAVQ